MAMRRRQRGTTSRGKGKGLGGAAVGDLTAPQTSGERRRTWSSSGEIQTARARACGTGRIEEKRCGGSARALARARKLGRVRGGLGRGVESGSALACARHAVERCPARENRGTGCVGPAGLRLKRCGSGERRTASLRLRWAAAVRG